MFSELYLHDAVRLREGRIARMRAFLFPSTPQTTATKDAHISNAGGDPEGALERRYIEAINGMMRSSSDLGSYSKSISSSGSSQNSFNCAGDASDPPSFGGRQELQRVHSLPNLLGGHQLHSHHHHQLYHQSRLRRPGTPLMTSQSDVARYNVDQLARRYRTPVFHRREGGECIRFGQPNGLRVNRSGGMGEGDLSPQSPVKRWGSPLKRSSK